MSGLSRALVALAVAGFVLGLAAFALVTTSEREDVPGPSVVLALTLGWAFIGAGLYAWWRRPENRIGALMTMVGFFWFLGALTSADDAWAFTIGLALSSLWIAALVHMLVAFPTGRVAPGLERNVVRLVWFTATVAGPLSLLVFENEDCDDCPDNLLLVWANETAATVLEAIAVLILVVVLGGLVVVLDPALALVRPRPAARAQPGPVDRHRGRGRRPSDRPGEPRRVRRDDRRLRRRADRTHHRGAVRLPARPHALDALARRRGERAVRAARRRAARATRWPRRSATTR